MKPNSYSNFKELIANSEGNEFVFNATLPKSKRLSITVPGDVADSLEKLALKKNTRESEVIVTALRFFIFVNELINGGATFFVETDNEMKKLKIE